MTKNETDFANSVIQVCMEHFFNIVYEKNYPSLVKRAQAFGKDSEYFWCKTKTLYLIRCFLDPDEEHPTQPASSYVQEALEFVTEAVSAEYEKLSSLQKSQLGRPQISKSLLAYTHVLQL